MTRALVALAACAAAGCAAATEIVVVVRSDLPALTEVGLRFTNLSGGELAPSRCVALSDLHGWPTTPLTLALQPKGDYGESFRVTAAATCTPGSGPNVTNSAVVHFVPGKRLALELELVQACASPFSSPRCADGQTCDPATAGCIGDDRPTLPTFDPSLPAPDLAAPDLYGADLSGADLSGGAFEVAITANAGVQVMPAVAYVAGTGGFEISWTESLAGSTNYTFLSADALGGVAQPLPTTVNARFRSLLTAGTDGTQLLTYSSASMTTGPRLMSEALFHDTTAAASLYDVEYFDFTTAHAATYDLPAARYTVAHFNSGFVYLDAVAAQANGDPGGVAKFAYPAAPMSDTPDAIGLAANPHDATTLVVWHTTGPTLDGALIQSGSGGATDMGPPSMPFTLAADVAAPLLLAANASTVGGSPGYTLVGAADAGGAQVYAIDAAGKVVTVQGVGATTLKVDALALASDGAGHALCVLEQAGALHMYAIDASTVAEVLPPAWGDTSVMRAEPAIAYDPVRRRYLVAYTKRTQPASQIYGVFYAP